MIDKPNSPLRQRIIEDMTARRYTDARHLTTVHKPRRAPVVSNQEEMLRLLEAAPGLK
jgi:integrase/recombinase XerD